MQDQPISHSSPPAPTPGRRGRPRLPPSDDPLLPGISVQIPQASLRVTLRYAQQHTDPRHRTTPMPRLEAIRQLLELALAEQDDRALARSLPVADDDRTPRIWVRVHRSTMDRVGQVRRWCELSTAATLRALIILGCELWQQQHRKRGA